MLGAFARSGPEQTSANLEYHVQPLSLELVDLDDEPEAPQLRLDQPFETPEPAGKHERLSATDDDLASQYSR